MIVLSQTTDKIQVVLAGAVVTNQPQCIASWRDITLIPSYVAGRSIVNTNGATDVDFVASPALSTQRLVDLISVYNRDTAAVTVTLKLAAAGTPYILWSGSIPPGHRLEYTSEAGFRTSSETSLTVRVDEGATYTYVGEATPGTAQAAAQWRIRRITNADTTTLFADGNSNFDNIWNDRTTLTYA